MIELYGLVILLILTRDVNWKLIKSSIDGELLMEAEPSRRSLLSDDHIIRETLPQFTKAFLNSICSCC